MKHKSIEYLDKIVELISLGAEINIKARLTHLKRIIEEENEQLNKPDIIQAERSEGLCVSCEQEKETHELCLECAIKLGHENPKAQSEGAAVF